MISSACDLFNNNVGVTLIFCVSCRSQFALYWGSTESGKAEDPSEGVFRRRIKVMYIPVLDTLQALLQNDAIYSEVCITMTL